ncbi:MAG: hypothetical protein P1V20_10470 [Verrucomicrobiales bacterium]|nr:hypothetical protein [Verrucomicrobiales bacterium]
MRKILLITALVFSAVSIFIQYKSIVFAASIMKLIQEFGKVLTAGAAPEKITEFFFVQAEEIRLFAQDSFIAQQISLSLLTGSIICLAVALFLDPKPAVEAEK